MKPKTESEQDCRRFEGKAARSNTARAQVMKLLQCALHRSIREKAFRLQITDCIYITLASLYKDQLTVPLEF